jgi:hypothetical protein
VPVVGTVTSRRISIPRRWLMPVRSEFPGKLLSDPENPPPDPPPKPDSREEPVKQRRTVTADPGTGGVDPNTKTPGSRTGTVSGPRSPAAKPEEEPPEPEPKAGREKTVKVK